MKNPYISQVLSIKEEVKKRLPCGLDTTADMLLEFMTFEKCLNDNIKAQFGYIFKDSYA